MLMIKCPLHEERKLILLLRKPTQSLDHSLLNIVNCRKRYFSFDIYIRKIIPSIVIIKNLIGKHYIILSRLLILFTLLLLAFLSEPSYFIASIVPYCGSHLICSLGSQIGTEQLWTPIILLNSPYGGSAVGSSSTSTQSSIRIVSGDPDYGGALIETSATDSVTSQISESNGSAGGVFELDTWTFYQAVTVRVGGDGQDNPCTQPYVARITATNPTSIHTM